jgi:hypothetical protein
VWTINDSIANPITMTERAGKSWKKNKNGDRKTVVEVDIEKTNNKVFANNVPE